MKILKFTLWAGGTTILILATIIWLGSGLKWKDIEKYLAGKWNKATEITTEKIEENNPPGDVVPDGIDDAIKKKVKDVYKEDKRVIEDLLDRF